MKLNLASCNFMGALHKMRGIVITTLMFLCVMVLPSMTSVSAATYTNGQQVTVGDYTYTFDTAKNGWHVAATDKTKTTYSSVTSPYDGYDVKSMGAGTWGGVDLDGTFTGCTNLVSLPSEFVIPSFVTNMSDFFKDCSKLTSLPYRFVVPATVTNANGFFNGCNKLSGVVEIEPKIQVGVNSDTASEAADKLYLNYNDRSVGFQHLFSLNTQGITNVVAISYVHGQETDVGEYVYTFDTDDQGWHVRVADKTKTTYGLITTPYDGYPVKSIGSFVWGGWPSDGIFEGCTNLIELPNNFVVPPAVTDISGAFKGCSSLISLPNNFAIPTAIERVNNLFEGCSNLTKLPENFQIPNNSINYGGVTSFLAGCSSLTKLPENFKIPDKVTSADEFLSGCSSLESLPENFKIPDKVTSANAFFSGCSSLTSLPTGFNLHKDLDHTNDFFSGCSKLSGTVDVFNDVLIGVDNLTASKAAEKLVLNYTDEVYANEVHANNQRVYLANNNITSVIVLPRRSFSNGQQVEVGDYTYTYEINFYTPDDAGWHVQVTDTTKTTYGLIQAFYGGYPVKSMGQTTWGYKNRNGTFENCRNLQSLPDDFVIPSTVTNTSYLFSYCSSLERLPDGFTLPERVDDTRFAFAGCTKLTTFPDSFSIPDTTRNVFGLFFRCIALTSLPDGFTIPSSVTDGGWIFWECHNLSGTVNVLTNLVGLVNVNTAKNAAEKFYLKFDNVPYAIEQQNALDNLNVTKVVVLPDVKAPTIISIAVVVT